MADLQSFSSFTEQDRRFHHCHWSGKIFNTAALAAERALALQLSTLAPFFLVKEPEFDSRAGSSKNKNDAEERWSNLDHFQRFKLPNYEGRFKKITLLIK